MDPGILFGRLHPIVLHFPIACLLLVVLFEWLALLRRREAFGPSTRGLLVIGALSAVAAVLTGLRFMEETTFDGDRLPLFERHEMCAYAATAAAALAIAAGAMLLRRKTSAWRAAYLVLVHVAAAAVGIGAHAGAMLHWGSDFLGR